MKTERNKAHSPFKVDALNTYELLKGKKYSCIGRSTKITVTPLTFTHDRSKHVIILRSFCDIVMYLFYSKTKQEKNTQPHSL